MTGGGMTRGNDIARNLARGASRLIGVFGRSTLGNHHGMVFSP